MSTISMAVSVQLIEQEHYAQWLPYWLSYQEFYNVELSEEITLKTWARFLMRKSRFTVLLQQMAKNTGFCSLSFSSFNLG